MRRRSTSQSQLTDPVWVDLAVRLNDCGMAGPAARRWTCDIDASAVAVDADGRVLGETDRRRTPNRAMRRRLLRRAGYRCEAPGCEAEHHLHAHHVIHWADGGPTEEHNLVMLCPFHHHLVHEAAWSISGDPTAAPSPSWRPVPLPPESTAPVTP